MQFDMIPRMSVYMKFESKYGISYQDNAVENSLYKMTSILVGLNILNTKYGYH